MKAIEELKPYYFRCSVVGLFFAFLVLLGASSLDAVAVLVGAALSVANLWAFSVLVQVMLGDAAKAKRLKRGAPLLFVFLIFLKLGVIFTAIALACYFLNPIFVVVGLTSLIFGILWQTVSPR